MSGACNHTNLATQVFFLYDYYNTLESCLFDDMNNRILIFKITKKN